MQVRNVGNEEKLWEQSIAEYNKPKANNEPQTASVFMVDDKNMVGRNIQDKADRNLIKIADFVTQKSNKAIEITKIAGFLGLGSGLLGIFAKNILFKGPKPSTALVLGVIGLAFITISSLIELIGGKSKSKAANSKFAANVKDKSKIDFDVAPGPKTDLIEKAGKLLVSSTGAEVLSEKDLKKNAAKVLDPKDTHTRGIYFVDTKNDNQKAENLLIVDAQINSAEYDGLSEKGIKKQAFEIPTEYSDFVKKYLSSKEISKAQSDKFIEIIKALQTDGEYSSTQATAHDGRKEDTDIFDLSNDGYLNYGDINALKLYAHIKNANLSAEIIEKLQDENNWTLDDKKLTSITQLAQDDCFDLFDLNGDGNIDKNDFALFKEMNKNHTKFDINADQKIDNQDIALITEYFNAIIKRYNNKGEFLENTEEIMGGKNKMNILRGFIEDKENGLKAS